MNKLQPRWKMEKRLETLEYMIHEPDRPDQLKWKYQGEIEALRWVLCKGGITPDD